MLERCEDLLEPTVAGGNDALKLLSGGDARPQDGEPASIDAIGEFAFVFGPDQVGSFRRVGFRLSVFLRLPNISSLLKLWNEKWIVRVGPRIVHCTW